MIWGELIMNSLCFKFVMLGLIGIPDIMNRKVVTLFVQSKKTNKKKNTKLTIVSWDFVSFCTFIGQGVLSLISRRRLLSTFSLSSKGIFALSLNGVQIGSAFHSV